MSGRTLARKHDLFIMCGRNSMRRYVTGGRTPASMLGTGPANILDRLFTVNGFSKTYAMNRAGGWGLQRCTRGLSSQTISLVHQ